MTNHTATSQAVVLAAAEETIAASRTSQVALLVVVAETIYAPSARTSQLPVLVVAEEDAQPSRTSQALALVVYNEGARENNTLRAWSFVLDGNTFYVLHLGSLGTYVCNLTQGNQWSRWETQGMDNWNADIGLMWLGRVVAGDNQNPVLWLVDPEAENDEDDTKAIIRTATVNIPARGRKTTSIGMFSINAAAGYPSMTGAELQLRFSDDNGVTWFTLDPVVFEAGNFNQNLQFGSLGTFGQPGRILEITDEGGSMRLSDVDGEFSMRLSDVDGEFSSGDPWGE